MLCQHACLYTTCVSSTHKGYRRALDLLEVSKVTDGCEPPCGCWELSPGPLQEHPVLLTTKSSLQHPEIGT